MASRAVEEAVETYLRANWSESLVLTENLEQEIPQDGVPFLLLEFPVSDSDWPGLNGVQWREEGAFRLVIAVPRGEGMGRMRAWGETLANLFRGVDVGGEACCGVPDEPFSDDKSSEGLYFIGTMVVPYYRLSPGVSALPAPEAYAAQAVHLDGSTWLSNNSLVATDNGFISIVFWSFIATYADYSHVTIYVSDPNAYNAYILGEGNGTSTGRFGFWVSDGASLTATLGEIGGDTFPPGQWNCYIATLDTQTGTGKIYRGDTDITAGWSGPTGFDNAFNGLPFFFGGDGSSSSTIDLADVRIMPGVSLLDESGDIPQATRRLFIDADGKPVDPTVATAALGAPCILFSGGVTTFATNQGTGGVFTLTGSLTASDSSPGAPASEPTGTVS